MTLDIRNTWHELVIISTVLVLAGTVGYLIYDDMTRGVDRTYTQYDLVFAEGDDISDITVVPPDAPCTDEHNLVAGTTDTTIHLDTGPTDERSDTDDILSDHTFTFCHNNDSTTTDVVLHRHDGQITIPLDRKQYTLTDRTINTTIIQ